MNTIAAYAQDMSEFLNESELTERRAFIETFVKEIVVMPGDALLRYTVPMPDDSPHTRKERRGDGAERLSSVYRQKWWAWVYCRQYHLRVGGQAVRLRACDLIVVESQGVV